MKRLALFDLDNTLNTTAGGYKDAGFEIAVVSNRDSSLIEETRVKLVNTGWPKDCRYHLRAIDDHRHPSQWKLETIQNLLYYAEPIEVHIFDDDKSVLMKLGERFCFNRDVHIIPHNVVFE